MYSLDSLASSTERKRKPLPFARASSFKGNTKRCVCMVDESSSPSVSPMSWQDRATQADARRKAKIKPLPSNPKYRLSWQEALLLIDPPNADRWPDALTLNDIVALQTQDEAGQRALLESFAIDCGMGEVKCEVSPDVEYRQDLMRFTWTSRNNLLPSGVLSTIQAGRCYRVGAIAFKAWLESVGKSPSQHIQNWFDAVEISCEPIKSEAQPDVITAPICTDHTLPLLAGQRRTKKQQKDRNEAYLKIVEVGLDLKALESWINRLPSNWYGAIENWFHEKGRTPSSHNTIRPYVKEAVKERFKVSDTKLYQ
jgi:hypothetical protein